MSEILLDQSKIEYAIIKELKPSFLGLEYIEDENTFHVIVSKSSFLFFSTYDRIKDVYEAIQKHYPELFEKYAIVIECYDGEQMNDVIEEKLE